MTTTEATTQTTREGGWCDWCGTHIDGLPAVKKGTPDAYVEFCTYKHYQEWCDRKAEDDRLRKAGFGWVLDPKYRDTYRAVALDSLIYGSD